MAIAALLQHVNNTSTSTGNITTVVIVVVVVTDVLYLPCLIVLFYSNRAIKMFSSSSSSPCSSQAASSVRPEKFNQEYTLPGEIRAPTFVFTAGKADLDNNVAKLWDELGKLGAVKQIRAAHAANLSHEIRD